MGAVSSSLKSAEKDPDRQAFLPLFPPNKQHADEKWEHKQAREPRMCSPHSETMPLQSETIFSERLKERES